MFKVFYKKPQKATVCSCLIFQWELYIEGAASWFLFQRLEDPGEGSEVRVNHNDEVDRQPPFQNIFRQDSREPISNGKQKDCYSESVNNHKNFSEDVRQSQTERSSVP